MVGGAQVLEVRVSETHQVAVASHLRDAYDLVRLRVGELAQQDAINNAEDGRGGSDGEGQRQDYHRGKAGSLGQHPQAVTQILK